MRLAHGWRLETAPGVFPETVREFIRPALRAVPPAMASALSPCRIVLAPETGRPGAASRWTETEREIVIEVATSGIPPHDAALELLLCLGQALWTRLPEDRAEDWWRLLEAEVRHGVTGEIDERALAEKRLLLAGHAGARSRRRLAKYGAAAFAGTAAEYVHSLWHDVTVREGPEYLPVAPLRHRLELLARWFPPRRGYRLFPARRRH